MQSLPEQAREILIVEDEPLLRASMAQGLRRLRNLEVLQAGTVAQALALLDTHTPAVLVSDLDLPDGSGIEIAAALDQRRLRVPILFISAYVSKYRLQLASREDIAVYEKPVPLGRLRALVEECLDMGGAVTPSPFGVTDFIQLAAMGHHSVVIDVWGPKVRGSIVIERGEIVCATDNLGGGRDAFRRLAFLKGSTVKCRSAGRMEIHERNIEGTCDSVLLEAARVQDEELRSLETAWGDENEAPTSPGFQSARPPPIAWRPDPPSHPRIQAAPPAPAPEAPVAPPRPPEASSVTADRRFKELYEEGVDALLSKDLRRAFAAFSAAGELRPDHPQVRTNLQRLKDLGYG